MKHMAGVLLARLQSASKKSVEQPLTNVHAIKMREERDFYQKWLMAKFQIICKAKGWEMPLVAAFQLPETHMHSHYELPRSHTFTCAALDDNMVDALPASRSLTLRESDTLSLLSVNTGSNSVRTNPISTYLREMEMKVQQRKENVIAEGRKRASDLLIPKALPSEKHERLSELRYAKAHRLALKDDVSAHDELCATASVAQRAFRRLFNHTPRTRYAIVLSLVCILFLMLHPEPLWLFWELNPKKSSRAVLIAQDCVMVAYIILCALPHFLLCDAALVYAFHALELGSKAGEHVKQFYSDKVRSAVAAGSLGIVAISILKSAAKAWTRSSIWFASQVISSFRVEVLPHLYKFGVGVLELVPLKFVFESLTVLLGLLRVPMKYAIWFVWSPIKVLFNVVFLLNPVGKYTLAFFALCLSVCRRALQNVHEFVASSIDAGNGKLPLVAWRLDAFHTAQSLFMYTSVFLVTTLVLFHLTAQRPPPPTEFLNNVVNHEKERSSMSTASMRIPLQSGTNKTFDREDPMKRNGNHASGTDSVGSGVRRRFRFREKKVSSLSTIPAGRTTGGAPETLSHARSF